MDQTIFECQCCGDGTWGTTDGKTDKPGWMLIANIDGPNHICPTCVADPTALDHLKADDLYPNARIVPIP